VGKCAGANDGLIASGESDQPRRVTKRPCRSVVGRLLDTFDNDPNGVSAMQQSRSVSSEWRGAPSPIPSSPSTHRPRPRGLGVVASTCRGEGSKLLDKPYCEIAATLMISRAISP
jgi:hypothetical protein